MASMSQFDENMQEIECWIVESEDDGKLVLNHPKQMKQEIIEYRTDGEKVRVS